MAKKPIRSKVSRGIGKGAFKTRGREWKHDIEGDFAELNRAHAEAWQALAEHRAGVNKIKWKYSPQNEPDRARVEAIRYLVTGETER